MSGPVAVQSLVRWVAVGIRYVQGMNEMLAPIYYAFSAELEAAPAVQALLESVIAL